MSFSDPSDSSASHDASTATTATTASSRDSRKGVVMTAPVSPPTPAKAAHAAATAATPTRKPSVTKTSGLERKPSVTETAASAAAKKHSPKKTVNKAPSNQAAAAAKSSAQKIESAHHYRAIAYGDDEATPAAAATNAVAATPAPTPTPTKLTEAAVAQHNVAHAHAAKTNGRLHEARFAERPNPIDYSDDDDTISMNSESSWRRTRDTNRPMVGFSMRGLRNAEPEQTVVEPKELKEGEDEKEVKEAEVLADVKNETEGHHVPLPAAAAPPPVSILKKPSAKFKETKPGKPPVIKALPKPAAPPPAYSQHVLKRTPSNSSFERDRGAPSSAFKMMSLRDPAARPNGSAQSASGMGMSAGMAASVGAGYGASSGGRMFRSRFADSDSDSDVGQPAAVTMPALTESSHKSSHFGRYRSPTQVNSEPNSPHKKRGSGLFSRHHKDSSTSSMPSKKVLASVSEDTMGAQSSMQRTTLRDPAPVHLSAAAQSHQHHHFGMSREEEEQAVGKKKKFKGLRKVFGLK